MKEEFREYLIKNNYRVETPSGRPSTVGDYIKRIDSICSWEGCSWEDLAENIDKIVEEYDIGGDKEALGEKSHRSVRNALKAFRAFLRAA
ncbi:MAG: hypothetical protein IJ071_05095 [Ruminococcus sp.]|nr:hypothetical protein [Ruminococcus sp.]